MYKNVQFVPYVQLSTYFLLDIEFDGVEFQDQGKDHQNLRNILLVLLFVKAQYLQNLIHCKSITTLAP